jgi:predicted NBD/HSP70 family sugar kinase
MNRPQTADQALVRKLNTATVMECIRLNAPLSRAELATHTGLNRSTISSIIDDLIDQGFVHETALQFPTIGRPGVLLQLNPEGGFAIGVEIGVDFLSVMLTNFVAEVLWRKTIPIQPAAPQIEILEHAENLIEQAMTHELARPLRPLGIGVAVPGYRGPVGGVFAPNLKWTDTPLRLIWMHRFNLPVFIENEANCAALSELFFGIAHNVNNFIYLATGVGLGGGIVVDGRLLRGAHGFGGEIGHTKIYEGGERCGCGRLGCWETYVSAWAVIRQTRQKLENSPQSILHQLVDGHLDQITLATLAQAAEKNDPVALSVLNETAHHLAVGTANLINIFNPK